MKSKILVVISLLWVIAWAGPLVGQTTRSTFDILHDNKTVMSASRDGDSPKHGTNDSAVKCNFAGAAQVAKDCMLSNSGAFERTPAGSVGMHLNGLACAKHPLEAGELVDSFGKAMDACNGNNTKNCLLHATLAAKSVISYGSGLCDCAGLSRSPVCQVLKISNWVLSPISEAQCVTSVVHFLSSCTGPTVDGRCASALASRAPGSKESPLKQGNDRSTGNGGNRKPSAPVSPPRLFHRHGTPKPPSRDNKPGPLHVT